MSKVRIDKWLWSVRIFKSRTISTEYCRSGKVGIHEHKAKASSQITTGDLIHVQKNGYRFTFKVITLLEKRVGAAIAQEAYEDLTTPDELNKYESWYVGKAGAEMRERGAGRPTKRERRELDVYKGEYYFEDDSIE